MHHLHHGKPANHAPKKSGRQKMTTKFLEHLHDSELWSSYLPRIPRKLYLLAFLGVCLIVFALWLFRNGQSLLAWVSFGLLGGLLALPAILMGLFVRWRWGIRSGLRRQILDSIPWRGDEKVLDVGCGTGLLLNGAAARLRSGKATGIDLWAPHSGGGSLELLWKNARTEKVAGRVEFKEADARDMPFESETFDVVLSSGAVHHISHTRDDFDQAMGEMVRVLKPGGKIVIWDVEHIVHACANRLGSAGVECEVEEAGRFLNYDMGIVVGKKVDNVSMSAI
jgi:SAM-dependent methyltransferase